MRISAEGKIGIGLALLFGLGTGAVIVWPDDRWIGWAMMGVSALGLAMLGVHHFKVVHWFKRLNWMVQTLVIAIALVGSYVGYEYLAHAPPIDYRTELRKQFDTDFPNTLRHSSDWNMTALGPHGWRATITRTVYYDLEGRVVFVGFYIPDTPLTFEICKYLSGNWRAISDELRREVGIQMQMPGDVDRRDMSTFPVSGQVYIYHESDLTMRQKVSLTDMFKLGGADLEFRDPKFPPT